MWGKVIRGVVMNLKCQKIKCVDYLTDDGEPAWCNRAGCPAVVAVKKCQKVMGEQQHIPEKEMNIDEENKQ
jgi:hypothetical protein